MKLNSVKRKNNLVLFDVNNVIWRKYTSLYSIREIFYIK